MAKREIQENVTFIRTYYLCDIDGERLLEGKKLYVCFGCRRDICDYHRGWVQIDGEKMNVCVNCRDKYCHAYEEQLIRARNNYEEEKTIILETWRKTMEAKFHLGHVTATN